MTVTSRYTNQEMQSLMEEELWKDEPHDWARWEECYTDMDPVDCLRRLANHQVEMGPDNEERFL